MKALLMILPHVVIAITAYYFRYNPPQEINPMMGYRTKRSMKSQEAWDFSQKYSANLLSNWATASTIGLLINYFINKPEDPTNFTITSVVLMVILVIGVVYFTEKELKNKF